MAECFLEVNGKRIAASPGETLTDAALAGRIVIPQDCGSGQCGTCRVKVLSGSVDAQGTESRGTVLACRARLTGSAAIAFDLVPDRQRIDGVVTAITMLGPHTAEIRVETSRRLVWLAGQYVKLTFKGFPPRDLSPTFPADLSVRDDMLTFHMMVQPDGRVSSQLGSGIQPGHRIGITGPFGSAFLRRGNGRLIFASTGSGFAPIFAMAVSARLGQPWRDVVLVAGARHAQDLDMRRACDALVEKGAKVVLTASDGDGSDIATLRPQLLLPPLLPTDVVHAAGAPSLVKAVERLAEAADAEFHSDSFTAAPAEAPGLGARLKGLFGRAAGRTSS